MVHLEPADAWRRVAQRPSVVSGPAHHDLPKAGVEAGHHEAVEERGPHPEVFVHPAVRHLDTARHISGERVLRLRVARRPWQPRVAEPVSRDPPGSHRRPAVSYHLPILSGLTV